MLSCRYMAPWLSTHSPTTKRWEGGGASHQRGDLHRPPRRLYDFRRQRRHLYWRPQGRSLRQRSGTIYLPRAEPSTRPGGVSRSRTEPLAPRAKGPAAPSTLAAKPRQPSGILESTAQIPVPVPTAPPALLFPSKTTTLKTENTERKCILWIRPVWRQGSSPIRPL